MAPAPGMCHGRVFGEYRSYACPNRGKVEREGKLYCGRHDPVAIKARVDARDTKLKAKWAESANRDQERSKKMNAYPVLVAFLRDVVQDGGPNMAPLLRVHAERAEALLKSLGESDQPNKEKA